MAETNSATEFIGGEEDGNYNDNKYCRRVSGFNKGVFGIAKMLLGRGPRSRMSWRFLKQSAEGQTWLLSVEVMQHVSGSKTDWWWLFTMSVLPAPLIGSVVGGPSLSTKCIIVASQV